MTQLACIPFTEGFGTRAGDISGSRRHVVFEGPVRWEEDNDFMSIYFNGVDARCWMKTFDSSVLTIIAWVKVQHRGSAEGFHIVEGAPSYVFRVNADGEAVILRQDSGDNWRQAYGPYKTKRNIWYHVACVDDGTYMRTYINGESGTALDRSGYTWKAFTADIEVGYASWWADYGKGNLAYLEIWNEAKSASFIQDHMASTRPGSTKRMIGNINLGDDIYIQRVDGKIGGRPGVTNIPMSDPDISYGGTDLPTYKYEGFCKETKTPAGYGLNMKTLEDQFKNHEIDYPLYINVDKKFFFVPESFSIDQEAGFLDLWKFTIDVKWIGTEPYLHEVYRTRNFDPIDEDEEWNLC